MTEIFGVTLSSEAGLGDITGVVALLVSVFTLAFGMWQWNRTRKSGQNKIAKEQMDKITMKHEEFTDFVNTVSQQLMESGTESGRPVEGADIPLEVINGYIKRLDDVLYELKYFNHLVTNHEIEDKKIIEYYKPEVRRRLTRIELADQRFVHLYLEPLEGFRKIAFEKRRLQTESLVSQWKG